MSNPSQSPIAGPVLPIDPEEEELEESKEEEEEEVRLIPRQKEKDKAKLEKNREGDTIISKKILRGLILVSPNVPTARY